MRPHPNSISNITKDSRKTDVSHLKKPESAGVPITSQVPQTQESSPVLCNNPTNNSKSSHNSINRPKEEAATRKSHTPESIVVITKKGTMRRTKPADISITVKIGNTISNTTTALWLAKYAAKSSKTSRKSSFPATASIRYVGLWTGLDRNNTYITELCNF